MRLSKISRGEAGETPACVRITQLGLRGEDDIVTLTDEAALRFCREEGETGLCTAKFRADLVADELPTLSPGDQIALGEARLVLTSRVKGCHPGCQFEPAKCRLRGRLLFFKVSQPGTVCVNDCIQFDKK